MLGFRNVTRNLAFDIILTCFLILLITSPVWFDLNDIIYTIYGLKSYVIHNFVPSEGSQYWLLIPIGLIGTWRWSVWVIKKATASVYAPIEPKSKLDKLGQKNLHLSLAIITPVYDEDPKFLPNVYTPGGTTNPMS